jgi:hypothetical protein
MSNVCEIPCSPLYIEVFTKIQETHNDPFTQDEKSATCLDPEGLLQC